MWRARFERGFGPVVRQTINEINNVMRNCPEHRLGVAAVTIQYSLSSSH